MLYEATVESMDEQGRVWCVVPALLGSVAHGPFPVLEHARPGVVIGAGVYVVEVAKSEDRFVVIGVMA